MLDKAVIWSCVVFGAWAAVGPGKMGLPIAAHAVLVISPLIILLGHMCHMWKHLGAAAKGSDSEHLHS
jgi:hypothetical protein